MERSIIYFTIIIGLYSMNFWLSQVVKGMSNRNLDADIRLPGALPARQTAAGGASAFRIVSSRVTQCRPAPFSAQGGRLTKRAA
jgi:hypothetical protein